MLSSSSTISRIAGSAIIFCAAAQARSAAATSRARSCVSQVKPSPSVCHSTWSPNFSTAVRSPDCQAPLPNCTTPQRKPRPSARSISPKAAVDLPLPLPVWTISRPFSIVLAATSASCAALRLAILALWRSASSVLVMRGTMLGKALVIKATGPYQAGDGKGTRSCRGCPRNCSRRASGRMPLEVP